MEKIKVLITGSSGMLGGILCEALLNEYRVLGLDLFKPQTSILNPASFIRCDMTDRDNLFTLVERIKPDLIIHSAAYTDVDGSELNPEMAFALNTRGTENIASMAKELGAVLFYISTDYVFDGSKDKPYTETDIPNPVNIYGKSKLDGEKIIETLLDKYLVLRTSWLFGPYGKNFVSTILENAKKNKILRVVDDQVSSPTYTLDLAKAIKHILATLDSSPSTVLYGIYHITNSGSCSWYEFAKQIVSFKQLGTKILPIMSLKDGRPAQRPKMSVLDNSKFSQTFKLGMRPWPDALAHFLTNYS